jgi:hypothetical protein
MMRTAVCPLFIVRQTKKAEPIVRHIGICCDLDSSSQQIVDFGAELALFFNAEITMMHAMESAIDYALVDPTAGPYDQVQYLLQEKL